LKDLELPLNYNVRLSDSRKTTDMLGPLFGEGERFVQEVVSVPIHNLTLSSDSKKYHGPDCWGACKENCFWLVLNYVLNPSSGTGNAAIEGLF